MAKDKEEGALAERYTRKFGDTDDDNNDDNEGEIDISPRPTAEQRDLAMLMDEIGASPKATVTIYRTTASKGKGAYIMQYPLSSKSLQEVMDYLRDVKKGGEFRFYIHDGSNMRGNQPVIVEPPTPEEIREYEAKIRSTTLHIPQSQPAQNNDGLALILQKMQDDQQRRDDQYREEQKRRDEQAREERRLADERAERELKRQEENNKFMLQLLTNNKPEKSSLSELLEGMVAMQALSGGNKKESDPLEMIDRVLGIQQKLVDNAPGAAKEGGVAEAAIKHMGGPLLTLLSQLNQQPVVNPLPRRASPKLTETPVNENVVIATAPDQIKIDEIPVTQSPEEKLAMILAEIITAAQQNADPAPYADKLIEGLGPDACADVVDDDQAFEFLMVQLGQPAIAHRPWFDKLREIMLDSLFEDDPEAANNEQNTDLSDETGP